MFSWFKDQTQNHMDAFTDFSTALDLVADATDEVRPVPGFAQDSLLYPDLPAHLYHADRDALSCSLLKPLLVSPAHFQAALTATQSSSDAKDFGTLLHLLLLQPHLTGQEVAVYPEIVSPLSRDYKAFLECNSHKLVVDEPTFTKARLLADKVRETRYKGRPLGLFLEEAQTEVSIYFTEPTTGLRLRVRTTTIVRRRLTVSVCSTPKRCSSSITTRPRSLNAMSACTSRCVPMTISTAPAARSRTTWSCCLRVR